MRAWGDEESDAVKTGKIYWNSNIQNPRRQQVLGAPSRSGKTKQESMKFSHTLEQADDSRTGFGNGNRVAGTQPYDVGYHNVQIDSAEDWDNDIDTESYSQPTRYQFNESKSKFQPEISSGKDIGWGRGTTQQRDNVDTSNRQSKNGSTEQRNYGRGRSSRFGSRDGGDGPRVGTSHNDGEATEVEVPSKEVRRIIGKGGSKIRELEQNSSCRIKINKENDNGITAVIQLLGSEDAQRTAKQMIERIVSSNQHYGNDQSGFPSSREGGFGGNRGFGGDQVLEIEVSSRDVARIIGRGGSKIRELQDDSGARIKINKDRDNGVTTVVELQGSEDAQQKAKQLIEDLTANQNSYKSNEGGFGGSRNEGGFGGSRNEGGFCESQTEGGLQDDDLEIEVGTKDVPRLIGKGGCKIQELQNKSGAKISVGKDDDWGLATTVHLKGSREAQKQAKKLIEDLLNPDKVPDMYENLKGLADKLPAPEPRQKINWGRIKEESEEYERQRWKDVAPVEKNFYIEHPDVTNMHPDTIKQIRKENNNIMVFNLHEQNEGVIPNPVKTFEQAFEHYPDIMREIRKAGFTEPSPIQKQGWPIALQGIDLIGIAQTGTGKTLAFLLPAFIHIEGQAVPRSERKGPTVLVLSPTRELALQIQSEVAKYSYRGIKCCCVYGGGSRQKQIQTVSQGVEIVVATPGRLNDLINNGILSLKDVTYLVLDEADRMLDMGFEPEIRKVLLDIRPDRHTLMTSATWPEGVRRLASSYMKNPMQVYVGSLDLAAVHSVRQQVEILDDDMKRERLTEFLLEELVPEDKVIVFVGRKVTADDISSDLALEDICCQCIHGDREQSDREQAIQDLKDGSVRILVATDVASRGLDIKDITYVFNYDFPRNIEEYVHRVGRTGRAGRSGTAITLMTRNDWRNAKPLIEIMEEAGQIVPDELYSMAQRFDSFRERQKERRDEERRSGTSSGFSSFGGGGGRRGGGGRGRGGRGRRGGFDGICVASFDDPFSFS